MATVHELRVSRDDSSYELGKWVASITASLGADFGTSESSRVRQQSEPDRRLRCAAIAMVLRPDHEEGSAGVPRSLTTEGDVWELAQELASAPDRTSRECSNDAHWP